MALVQEEAINSHETNEQKEKDIHVSQDFWKKLLSC